MWLPMPLPRLRLPKRWLASKPLPMRVPARLVVACTLLSAPLLAACSSGAPQPAGGVSQGEAEALAAAAEMLDETRTLPAEAIPPEAMPEAAPPAEAEMTGDTRP